MEYLVVTSVLLPSAARKVECWHNQGETVGAEQTKSWGKTSSLIVYIIQIGKEETRAGKRTNSPSNWKKERRSWKKRNDSTLSINLEEDVDNILISIQYSEIGWKRRTEYI